MEAIDEVNRMYPYSILLMDRGFASENILSFLVSRGIRFIVRLRRGTSIMVGEQRLLLECMEPGKIVVCRNALYGGKVRVHIVGYRRSAVEETIWLALSDGVNINSSVKVYLKRFHVENAFRDLKSGFMLEKVMLRDVRILQRFLALLFMAYIISFMAGVLMRERFFSSSGRYGRFGPLFLFFNFFRLLPLRDRTLPLSLLPEQFHGPHLDGVQFFVRR